MVAEHIPRLVPAAAEFALHQLGRLLRAGADVVAEHVPRLVPAAAEFAEHQLRAAVRLQRRPRTHADVVAEDVARGVEAPADFALHVLNLRIARQRHGGEHVEQQIAQALGALQVAPQLKDQHAVPGGNEGIGLIFLRDGLAGRDFIELHLVFAHDGHAHRTCEARRSRGDHLVQRLSGPELHVDAGHQAAVLHVPRDVIQLTDALALKQRGFVLHFVAQGAACHFRLRSAQRDAQQQCQQQSPFPHACHHPFFELIRLSLPPGRGRHAARGQTIPCFHHSLDATESQWFWREWTKSCANGRWMRLTAFRTHDKV